MSKVCDSHISGTFFGWYSDETYELEDGTRWRLVESVMESRLTKNRPKARVYEQRGKYYLQVSGMGSRRRVQLIGSGAAKPLVRPLPKRKGDWAEWLNDAIQAEISVLQR